MNKQCAADDCTREGTEPMFDDNGPAFCVAHANVVWWDPCDVEESQSTLTPEEELAERWEAFRQHEMDAVMSGGQVDSPSDWGL